MHHPYQCLQVCSPAQERFLLAASGSKLFSVNLGDGSIVSFWPKEELETNDTRTDPVGDKIESVEAVEPPTKKRRVSSAPESSPNIIKVIVTQSQSHAVVVTAEDKTIRVFKIAADGQLELLSQRCMPKRPCATVISLDDTTIISGDKFGDVYSLPLLPTPEEDAAAMNALKQEASKTAAPTATEKTVHSKANRRALETQQKQAKEGTLGTPKVPLAFAHELLLGHVSMLTDIAVATVGYDEKLRSYILTADRDEHIRISRGPPQSFVIEGFCLGHREFVSKLCLPEPTLLVSAGGDSDLFVWDWLDFKLAKKVDLYQAVARARKSTKDKEGIEDSEPVAVTGLWKCPGPSLGKSELLVSVEGVPALFHLPLSSLRDEKEHEVGYIRLPRNVLDVTIINGGIIVSIDNIHEQGSTSDVDQGEGFVPRLQAFDLIGADLDGGGVWKANDHLDHMLIDLNAQSTVEWHENGLQALLYGVEQLRKRGVEDDVESKVQMDQN